MKKLLAFLLSASLAFGQTPTTKSLTINSTTGAVIGTPTAATIAATNSWGGGGGSSLTPTAVKTSAYNAAAGDFVPCDTTSASFTVTLPTAPADGSVIGVKQITRGGTNTVTVATGGSDVFNKAGGGTTLTLTLLNQAATMQYKATGAIWYITGDDLTLSQLDIRFAPISVTGNVTGPGSSTANNVVTWNGTGGTSVKDSGANINAGAMTGVNTITANATTNATINGGSSGANITAGQGANGNVTVAPPGTGSIIATFTGDVDHTLTVTKPGNTSRPNWVTQSTASVNGDATLWTIWGFGSNFDSLLSTKPVWGFAFEDNYKTGSIYQDEFYFTWGSTPIATAVRPISILVNRATGATTVQTRAATTSINDGTDTTRLQVTSGGTISTGTSTGFGVATNNIAAIQQLDSVAAYRNLLKLTSTDITEVGSSGSTVKTLGPLTLDVGPLTFPGAATITGAAGVLTVTATDSNFSGKIFASGSTGSDSGFFGGNISFGAKSVTNANSDLLVWADGGGKWGSLRAFQNGGGANNLSVYFTSDNGSTYQTGLKVDNSAASITTDYTTEATTGSAGSLVTPGGIYAAKKIIGNSTFTPKAAASVTTSGAGEFAFDTDAWASGRGAMQLFDGTANTNIVATLTSDTPTNRQWPMWNTGGTITWETIAATDIVAGALANGMTATTQSAADNSTKLATTAYADAAAAAKGNITGTQVSGNLSVGSGANAIAASNITVSGNNTTFPGVGNITAGGVISTSNATASTSSTTGALQVTGGAGFGGALYMGGVFNQNAGTRSSVGTAPYVTITTPTDSGITAATEGIGFSVVTGTRTWATTGTVALQREVNFAGPTYASAAASQTFTDATTMSISAPVAGTNATFTRGHSLLIVDSTSATTAITGGLVVANSGAVGTAATSVGIGGGNIFAGGAIQAAGSLIVSDGAAVKLGTTRGRVKSSADGIIELFNLSENNFTRLNFGGTTSSFVSLQSSGTTLTVGTADGGTSAGALAVSGALTTKSATAGIGYATGAGGTVTQTTSRTTGVTLSKVTGSITTDTTSLAGLASASFTVTNTAVAIGDTIILSIRSGQTNKKTIATVTTVAAGSFEITIYNADAVTAEVGAIIINFAVVKAVTS